MLRGPVPTPYFYLLVIPKKIWEETPTNIKHLATSSSKNNIKEFCLTLKGNITIYILT